MSTMKFFSLVVVIPIGPSCRMEFIEDTINSIVHYTTSACKIILADDSQKGTGKKMQKIFPQADVVTTPASMGKLGGLYVTLSLAFKYAIKHYHFDALLRIDTDALVIGKNPEEEAIQLFKENKNIGIAGQYPYTYDGEPWDLSWPVGQIKRFTKTPAFFKHPFSHLLLWMFYLKAKSNGYQTGESVFGGACFYSEACLRALNKKRLLPFYPIKKIYLEEDHLFSLLIKAIGMDLGSLSVNGSMACKWQGLPASPEELLDNNKKITHSTRYWKDLKEEEIRNFFRQKRQEEIFYEMTSTVEAQSTESWTKKY